MICEFEDDWFDRHPGWVEEHFDLVTETVNATSYDEHADDSIYSDDLPDLSTESTDLVASSRFK